MRQNNIVQVVRELDLCVGLSVWRVDDDGTSTALAVDDAEDDLTAFGAADAAVLDAVQYADSGPGTDAIGPEPVVGSSLTTMRKRWPLFAAAAGSLGVRGVVAIPILEATTLDRHLGRSHGDDGSGLLGVVVFYLTGPAVVNPALIRVAKTVGVTTLLPGVPTAGPDLQLRRLWSTRHQRTTPRRAELRLAAELLEREVGLEAGVGDLRLIDAAARAGIDRFTLAQALIEVLDD